MRSEKRERETSGRVNLGFIFVLIEGDIGSVIVFNNPKTKKTEPHLGFMNPTRPDPLDRNPTKSGQIGSGFGYFGQILQPLSNTLRTCTNLNSEHSFT